jgi:hypothetical protein
VVSEAVVGGSEFSGGAAEDGEEGGAGASRGSMKQIGRREEEGKQRGVGSLILNTCVAHVHFTSCIKEMKLVCYNSAWPVRRTLNSPTRYYKKV